MKDNTSQNMNFTNLSKDEKSRLKHKITDSIYSYIQRKRSLRYTLSATASILILFSIGLFNASKNDSSPIEDFAKTITKQSPDTHVKLILSDNNNIEITEDNSTIAYSNTGQKITIGSSKPVNQKTSKNNNIIFNTLIVPYGKRSEIVLADGSKVWLNSGSKLIFPAAFLGDKREVYLEGEAIFEVAHNKMQPFVVKSNNHDIEVLGTVFNVNNYTDDDSISTVLQSGSVQISFKNNSILHPTESIRINPGTMATYNKTSRELKTNTVEVEKYFSWREGIFIFKNDSLESIMKKISRYYNVEIIINDKNLANQRFSGYLDVKENIENVIQTIKETQTSRFEYHITDDHKLIIN